MEQENQSKISYVSCAREILDEVMIYARNNDKLKKLDKYDDIIGDFEKYRKLCESFDILHNIVQTNIKPFSDNLVKFIESMEMKISNKLQIDEKSKKNLAEYIKLLIELSDDYSKNFVTVTDLVDVPKLTEPTIGEYSEFKKMLCIKK